MSTKMEDDIKRWTAKRKSALVLDIIQGKTAVAEASRHTTCRPRRSSSGSMTASGAWKTRCAPIPRTFASSTSVSSRIFKRRMARRCWSCAREKLQSLLGEDEK